MHKDEMVYKELYCVHSRLFGLHFLYNTETNVLYTVIWSRLSNTDATLWTPYRLSPSLRIIYYKPCMTKSAVFDGHTIWSGSVSWTGNATKSGGTALLQDTM